jgi:hypothetical protein
MEVGPGFEAQVVVHLPLSSEFGAEAERVARQRLADALEQRVSAQNTGVYDGDGVGDAGISLADRVSGTGPDVCHGGSLIAAGRRPGSMVPAGKELAAVAQANNGIWYPQAQVATVCSASAPSKL